MELDQVRDCSTRLIPALDNGNVVWREAPPDWIGLRISEARDVYRAGLELFVTRPAAVRFVVVKPGYFLCHLHQYLRLKYKASDGEYRDGRFVETTPCTWRRLRGKPLIHWLILGPDDSGHSCMGRRPFAPYCPPWHRDMAAAAGVPFFFEGWGDWIPDPTAKIVPVPPIEDTSVDFLNPPLCPNGYAPWDQVSWAYGNGSSCWASADQMEGYYAGGVVRRPQPGENARLLDGREWNETPTA